MSAQEMRELDVWIAAHVTKAPPRIEAAAMTKDEKGMALWETDIINRMMVRDFCARNPEYHYVERKLYPAYSSNPAASDALDDALLAKLPLGYESAFSEGMYCMSRRDMDSSYSAMHSDKKICRCLFAKANF